MKINDLNDLHDAWIEAGEKRQDLQDKQSAMAIELAADPEKYTDEEIKSVKDELVKATKARDFAKSSYEDAKANADEEKPAKLAVAKTASAAVTAPKLTDKEIKDKFVNDFKGLIMNDPKIMNLVTSSTDPAGNQIGLVIPQDIETAIHQLVRQYDSLSQYVNLEAVSTQTGSRVYEKWTDVLPLNDLDDETATIADNDDPNLTLIKYVIHRYAGITTITNSLLKDTSENLMTWLTSWIAKKVVVTRNQKILAALAALPASQQTTLAKFDDIKTLINVKIDPAIKATSSFITNQSGFNALDQVKDAMGNYLLQKKVVFDSTKPGINGNTVSEIPMIDGRVIHVVADRWLPDVSGSHPLFFGDLHQAVTIFSREQMSLLTTNIGGGAFEKDQTKLRVIDRFDVELADSEAVISAPFSAIADQAGKVISTPAS